MDNLVDSFNLTVEEKTQFLRFKREIDLLAAALPPVKTEKEISRIEAVISQHVQEIIESVSKPDNKTDT